MLLQINLSRNNYIDSYLQCGSNHQLLQFLAHCQSTTACPACYNQLIPHIHCTTVGPIRLTLHFLFQIISLPHNSCKLVQVLPSLTRACGARYSHNNNNISLCKSRRLMSGTDAFHRLFSVFLFFTVARLDVYFLRLPRGIIFLDLTKRNRKL